MPRKRKSTKRATQSQVVKVNVKNVIQQIKERQGDMIQVKRKRPIDNFNTGGQSRLVAPHINYANPMPIFLPVQERTIYVAPEEKAIGNSVIPSRPDLVAQESNPADIAPSRPSVVAIRSSNPVASPYSRTPDQVYKDFERSAKATVSALSTSSRPPAPIVSRLMDESEDLVARSMDEESRALERYERDQYLQGMQTERRVLGSLRRQRQQSAHGTPLAPASGFPTPPTMSASASSASAQPATEPMIDESQRRQVIEEE